MLSSAQLRLYRAEWGKARRQLRALGHVEHECNAIRYQIHADCGAPQSSTDPAWTNEHLDAVLAHFFAWSAPGCLWKQERQANQPGRRCLYVCGMIMSMIADLTDADTTPSDNYVRAVFRRVNPDCSKDPLWAGTAEWSKVIAALTKHYDRRACKALGRTPLRHRIQFPLHAHADTVKKAQHRRRMLLAQADLSENRPF